MASPHLLVLIGVWVFVVAVVCMCVCYLSVFEIAKPETPQPLSRNIKWGVKSKAQGSVHL